MPTDGYAMGNPNPQTIKLVGACFAFASSRCFPPVLLSCSILRLQLLDPCTSRPETGQRKSESLSQPLGKKSACSRNSSCHFRWKPSCEPLILKIA